MFVKTHAGDQMTIGPAADQDVPAVLALLERSKLPANGWRDHVDTTLVARDGDIISGVIALEIYGDAALLRSAAVDAAQRGRGLGSDLTRAVLELARARGVKDVYLLTETAGDFFTKFGFRHITRADVPETVKQSVEFTGACCASAVVLALNLS